MGADEDKHERYARELMELLNELRIALPGVQIMLAFLLTVPFSQRFSTVTAFQRDVYFGVLLSATVASVLLIAPSAYHRLLFRHGEKARLLEVANVLALAGLAFLALAITGVILLVSDVLFDNWIVPVVTAAVALLLTILWCIAPLVRRHHLID